MKKGTITLAILSVFTLLGAACWFLQLIKGAQVTHLNNYIPWGLYVIGFVIFTGIVAGSLIFSSSAYLFKVMEKYKPYTRISSYVGVLCGLIGAGLFISADMGNPQRGVYIMIAANINSPQVWDTIILMVYGIIGILFTRQLLMVWEGKKEEKSLKTISWAAFTAGLLVMVTSFVFAMQVSSPSWNNPVEPLSFLAAALVAALSVLIITFVFLHKTGYIRMSNDELKGLGSMVVVFLLFELFVILSEVGIGLYAGGGEESIIIHWMVAEKGAPFFWVEIIAILIGMVALTRKNANMTVSAVGASVSIFAVFMIKYNLLQAQFLNPLLSYAGPDGYNPHRLGVYLPSMIEIGIFVGIISLVCLVAVIGLNKLNLGFGKEANSKVDYNKGTAINL